LSIYKPERQKQVKALLRKEWLMAAPKDEPVVLCGDLNAIPLSAVYRRLSDYLTDVQKSSNILDARKRHILPAGQYFVSIIFLSPIFSEH